MASLGILLCALVIRSTLCFIPVVQKNPLIGGAHRLASRLHSQESNDDVTYYREKRTEGVKTLRQIDLLRNKVKDSTSDSGVITSDIAEIEEKVFKFTSQLLAPEGLSLEDYKAAIESYLTVPFAVRQALCEAVGYPSISPADALFQAPEVVGKLFENRYQLTPQRLQDLYKAAVKRSERPLPNQQVLDEETDQLSSFFSDISSEEGVEKWKMENGVKNVLPRATRNDGRVANEDHLSTLMDILDKSIFVQNGPPVPIPGGYLVRGTSSKETTSGLIEALDAKLPLSWNAQVCVVQDVVMETNEFFSEPALLLVHKDMSQVTNRAVLSFISAAAIVTTFLWSFTCLGDNEAVAKYISDMAAVSDAGGVDWFNGKLADLLLPLVAIQGLHETGHFLIASRDKIQTSPPTLIPFLKLPFLGAQTQITSSPKDLTSLFDFAFMGPLMGMLGSLIFMVVGLQATMMANADAEQYFPVIPVELIKLSTLGGSIVDAFYGASGMITSQDPSTNIPMHPYAIAGFCGLMINSFEMLPLGSTDGGRLSQAIFGRGIHVIVGAITWTTLCLSGLFLEGHNELLIYAWVVYNFCQNDMEVPCRNEIDRVQLPRVLAGGLLATVAAMSIFPII